jgi:bifunctional non-homologous end joining protein LigD
MSLEPYRRKRNFDETPEPEPLTAEPVGPALRFVVQLHRATRLHYDFRLELDGALKSWAVPKGPSLNPADKRLAMMVEDHPLEYRNFEGIIPAGNYGAGAVIIWDEGTYRPLLSESGVGEEEMLRRGLAKGDLKFTLEGQKLHGAFGLVKIKRENEPNAWLLIKKQDGFVTTDDVTRYDHSARSNETLDSISRAPETIAEPALDLSGAKPGPMPGQLSPMLASLAEQPFDRDGWFFEIKWDGYRALAFRTDAGVRLVSRRGKDFTATYPAIAHELAGLASDAVLDGEIVVVDNDGKPHFGWLQQFGQSTQGLLIYYVFDILHLGGYDLRPLPLRRRREILASVLRPTPHVRISEAFEARGSDLFRAAGLRDLEGIIAKDGASPYRSGARTQEWLKLKTHQEQEAVIGGYTEPQGGRKYLGAVLLGMYEGGKLIYAGHAGTGLDDGELADLWAHLAPLATNACPFAETPKANAAVTWVRPELVGRVRFAEWTMDGHLREPVFLGLRDDVDAQTVRRERAVNSSGGNAGPTDATDSRSQPGGPVTPVERSLAPQRRYARPDASENRTLLIEGRTVRITHADKVLWPEDRITKENMIEYYRLVAPMILPYLRDRPLALHRFPNGVSGQSFFQKDMGDAPDWMETATITSEGDGRPITSVICQDEASLIHLANLACIELNPWSSRRASLDLPDYLILDLDPEAIEFEQVIRVANGVHQLLEEIDTPCYVKTSGATGLHVCVPLGARYDYDQTRQFANLVAFAVNSRLPDITSLERKPEKRQGRVYLDYLQNGRGKTIAVAYGLRPRRGAPVSTPLQWDEVRPGLDPAAFNIRSMSDRMARTADPFRAVLGPGIDMAHSLECLARVMR